LGPMRNNVRAMGWAGLDSIYLWNQLIQLLSLGCRARFLLCAARALSFC